MTLAISIISPFIAAFLAHYFATNRMRKDDLSKFQLIAYSDFLGAVSRLSVSRRLGNTENEIDDLTILNDAKNRILVCGNPKIIKALIKFWGHGSTLEKEQEILAFRDLIKQIRESLGYKKNDLHYEDIKDVTDIIFKLEPSTFSFRARHEKV